VGISVRLLNEGEHVIVTTHTHAKALLMPALWLVLVAALVGYTSSMPSGHGRTPALLAIAALGLVLLLWLVVVPFLRWLTTSYTITDRRLITRTGILSRRGHDIPLARVIDVAYEHGLVDRLLGCGTLVLSDASERGQVRLPDIPHVERVHLQLSDLLFSGLPGPAGSRGQEGGTGLGERRSDDGT
jgi:uncharacterized membrane protein YdbT with pleckstrin-like domain